MAKAEVELKQIETRQPAQATQVSQTDQETVEPRPSEVVKQVKAEVQSEPNLQRASRKSPRPSRRESKNGPRSRTKSRTSFKRSGAATTNR